MVLSCYWDVCGGLKFPATLYKLMLLVWGYLVLTRVILLEGNCRCFGLQSV